MCLSVSNSKSDHLEALGLVEFPFFILENIEPRCNDHSIIACAKMQSAWSSCTLRVVLINDNLCADG